MIRTFLIAAGALALAGAAIAQSATLWTDPEKSFSFDNTQKWPVDAMTPSGANFSRFVAGTANEECTFQSIPRTQSADRSPASVKSEFSKPLTPELWVQISSTVPYFSRDKITPTIVEASVDTSGAWPIQIATLNGKDDAVITAALHARPGRDIWAYCQSFDGQDRKAAFLAVAKSVTTPKDAEFAAAEAAAAAAAAAEAAAKAAAAETPKKKR